MANYHRHKSTLYRKKPQREHKLHLTAQQTAEYIEHTKAARTYWSAEIQWHDS